MLVTSCLDFFAGCYIKYSHKSKRREKRFNLACSLNHSLLRQRNQFIKKLEATDYTASTIEKWRRINSYFLQPRIRSKNSVTYSRQVYFDWLNRINLLPHRQAQISFIQVILDCFKLTISAIIPAGTRLSNRSCFKRILRTW